MFIENLTGTASGGTHPTSITNSTIRNNWEFEIQITNNAGSATTLTNLQMSGNTISADGTQPNHGNLMNFLAVGTGPHNMTLNLTGGSFTGNSPRALQISQPVALTSGRTLGRLTSRLHLDGDYV